MDTTFTGLIPFAVIPYVQCDTKLTRELNLLIGNFWLKSIFIYMIKFKGEKSFMVFDESQIKVFQMNDLSNGFL